MSPGRWLRVLARAVAWDLKLQWRQQVVTVAAVVTLLYVALLAWAPRLPDPYLVLFLFSDPTVFGFLFVGVLVLFERGSHTLAAVAVTPLTTGQYIAAKAVSLTLLAVPSGVAMALAARGWGGMELWPLVAALALTSVLFILLGLVAVVRVRSVNEYLLLVPAAMTPLCLPVVGLLGLFDTPLFRLIPSQASLLLFRRAFAPRPAWEAVYGVGFLLLSIALSAWWAHRAFTAYVRGPGRPPERSPGAVERRPVEERSMEEA